MSNPPKSCIDKERQVEYNNNNPGYKESPFENETWDDYIVRQMQYEREIKNGR